MAKIVLGRHLADEPEDVGALCMLAGAELGLETYADAAAHAEQAVALAPDAALAWLTLGRVQMQRGRFREAQRAAATAVASEPGDPDCHALLAQTLLLRRRYREALRAADQGLALDPEHGDCANIRAAALTRLGHHRSARRTMRGVLRRDPEDSFSHANRGWSLLHEGDYHGARRHLTEALRLDPENEWAREGVIEALKAHSPLYRPALRLLLWLGNLRLGAQIALLVGAYGLSRVCRAMLADDPPYALALYALVVVYFAFVALTWFSRWFANGLLLLHPFGRRALTTHEMVGGTTIVTLLGLAAALAILGWQLPALVLAASCAPLRCALDLETAPARAVMLGYTALVALFGGAATCVAYARDSEREALLREVERARAVVAERDRLRAERDAALAELDHARLRELAEEARQLRTESEAFAAHLEAERVDERLAATEDNAPSARTLGLIFGLLAFVGSQLLHSALAARELRR